MVTTDSYKKSYKGEGQDKEGLLSLAWRVQTPWICEKSPLLCKQGQGEVETPVANLPRELLAPLQGTQLNLYPTGPPLTKGRNV